MTGIVRLELRRAFRGRSFAVSLGLGCLIVAAHLWRDVVPMAQQGLSSMDLYGKVPYPPSLYQAWLGTRGSISLQAVLYFLLLPLLATLPFGASLYSDKKSGYVVNVRTRVTCAGYYGAKCLAVFSSAAAAVTLPLILDLGLTAVFIPALRPEPTVGTFPIFEMHLWSTLYYTHPLVYIAVYSLVIALWAGAIGLIALLVSFVVPNRVLVLAGPLVLLVLAEFAVGLIPFAGSRFSPLTFLRPDQSSLTSGTAIVVEWCVVMLAVLGVMAWRARVDEAR